MLGKTHAAKSHATSLSFAPKLNEICQLFTLHHAFSLYPVHILIRSPMRLQKSMNDPE
jgi:hypothetical protein